MEVPARKRWIKYAGSEEDFVMWSFYITLKRKFLFYTVNLIVPLVSHAFITVLVFYLPADSREKIALCINILLSLTVFFLMLAEIIPPTSIVVPLLGKYLVFTLVLVATSVIITVITYNVHFRTAATHTMPDWVRKLFLYWMPRILMMRRPKIENSHDVELKYIKLKLCPCFAEDKKDSKHGYHHHFHHNASDGTSSRYQFGSKRTRTQMELIRLSRELDEDTLRSNSFEFRPEVQKAIEGAIFIANHLKQEDEANRVRTITFFNFT
jgi:nicotinic acetylcholine receptor